MRLLIISVLKITRLTRPVIPRRSEGSPFVMVNDKKLEIRRQK